MCAYVNKKLPFVVSTSTQVRSIYVFKHARTCVCISWAAAASAVARKETKSERTPHVLLFGRFSFSMRSSTAPPQIRKSLAVNAIRI